MKNINEDIDIFAEADSEECTLGIKIHKPGDYCYKIELDYETSVRFRNKINAEIKKLMLENLTTG